MTGATGVPASGTVTLTTNRSSRVSSTQAKREHRARSRLQRVDDHDHHGSYTSQISTFHGTSPSTQASRPRLVHSGTLGSPTWTPSSYAVGSATTYCCSFTRGSGAALNTITMSVPPGTAGIADGLVVTRRWTRPPQRDDLARVEHARRTRSATTFLNAGYSVSLQIGGSTNTSTPGSFSSQLATKTSTTPVDTGSPPTSRSRTATRSPPSS